MGLFTDCRSSLCLRLRCFESLDFLRIGLHGVLDKRFYPFLKCLGIESLGIILVSGFELLLSAPGRRDYGLSVFEVMLLLVVAYCGLCGIPCTVVSVAL